VLLNQNKEEHGKKFFFSFTTNHCNIEHTDESLEVKKEHRRKKTTGNQHELERGCF